MNQGQEQFFSFIIERTKEDKQEEVKQLLSEGFSKQQDGTFNKEYLESFMPKMISLLKEEYVEEVRNIMIQFGSKY